MTTLLGHDPLLQAVVLPNEGEATAAWQSWRSATVIDDVSWRDVLLVSMIRPDRLRTWITGDPAAGILEGLLRRNRAQATLRVGLARQTAADLTAAGIAPVMLAGPVAIFVHAGGVAARPITEIHLMVPRPSVRAAVDCLSPAGWRYSGLPRLPAADWADHLVLSRDDLVMRVWWRHLPVPPWRARHCEARLFARVDPVLPPEPLLASVLAAGGSTGAGIPWQADAAVLLSRPIDWRLLATEAHHSPAVAVRLEELRRIGLPVPPLRFPGLTGATRFEAATSRGIRRAVLIWQSLFRRPSVG